MSGTIALVQCVKEKLAKPMLAKDLYDSDWFHKASAYAEQIANRWYILSAKYGLLSPDALVAPYDQTLNNMPAAERHTWAKRVTDSLPTVLEPGDRVVILAGKRYREELIGPMYRLGCTIEIPMEGLRFGEQKHWLMQHIGQ